MDTFKTGCFIQALRKEKGMTQKELSEQLEVTDKAVSRWETGKGLPDTALLKPLAGILGVTVGEILAGERIPEQHLQDRTEGIILESLDYSPEDAELKKILCYIGYGVLTAFGGLFFALIVDRFGNGAEDLSVGFGMYLSAVAVTCTGVICARLEGKKR